MKNIFAVLVFLSVALWATAAPNQALVFSGYIDYPERHDFRIEVSRFDSGLISRIATYSGEPRVVSEDMVMTLTKNGIRGVDRFQQNIRTLEAIFGNDTIRIVIENENSASHRKTHKVIVARLRAGQDLLFEDTEKRYYLFPDNTFRAELKTSKSDAVVIRGNQVFEDGWYRSDWKRETQGTIIQEFTTMEIPGDWISSGGGTFVGEGLNSSNVAINALNYYILESYLDVRPFIPFIFGLKTGSY